jgi:mannose-6-phosphate isomerase
MAVSVLPLDNPVQNYAWGSRDAIAALLGRPNETGRPEAELWIGSHPKAPSLVQGGPTTLHDLIRSAPDAMLGSAVAREFTGELPFLLKVIAAAEPLSIQCHPDANQARAGFEREEGLGIPRDAFERSYRDPHHKPELVVALSRFVGLLGFRRKDEILRLAVPLGLADLGQPLDALARSEGDEGLRALFSHVLSLDGETRTRVAAGAADAAARRSDDPAHAWIVRLAEKYPGDVGVLAPLLLNLVELDPEEGLFLPAGELHAYLEGTAVEVMANSDNVLRGGLTPKHVDVDELLAVASFRSGPPERLRAQPRSATESVYRTPAREFELAFVRVIPGAGHASPPGRGVELLLGLDGDAVLTAEGRSFSVAKGRSVFVPAAIGSYRIEGTGRICRAGVPRNLTGGTTT